MSASDAFVVPFSPRSSQVRHGGENQPIRVLLADDQPLIRAGIRALLAREQAIEVVAEATDGATAVERVLALAPDIVLMDIEMPGLNGFEAAARLARAGSTTKVIVLSQHDDELTARRALIAGAKGYLLKSVAVDELWTAIQAVHRGQSYFAGPIGDYVASWAAATSATPDPIAPLSGRQREVLQLIAEGLSTRAIAARLSLSVSTIDTHRTELMRRLHLRDVAALVRFAIQHKLTAVEPVFR